MNRERVMEVWPCDHGGVRVRVPAHEKCGACGAKPIQVIPLSALTDLIEKWEKRAQNLHALAESHVWNEDFNKADAATGRAVYLEQTASDLRNLIEKGQDE